MIVKAIASRLEAMNGLESEKRRTQRNHCWRLVFADGAIIEYGT